MNYFPYLVLGFTEITPAPDLETTVCRTRSIGGGHASFVRRRAAYFGLLVGEEWLSYVPV